jgi:hypothetical protein
MTRAWITLWLTAGLATGGCSTCTRCGDECYTFYGGSVPRVAACSGRVGSRFDPAGESVEFASAEEMLEEETIVEELPPSEQDLPLPPGMLQEESEPATSDMFPTQPLPAPPASGSGTRGSSSRGSSTRSNPIRAPRVSQQDYLP